MEIIKFSIFLKKKNQIQNVSFFFINYPTLNTQKYKSHEKLIVKMLSIPMTLLFTVIIPKKW